MGIIWDEQKPLDTDWVKDGPAEMRNIKRAVREFMSVAHFPFGDINEGKQREGTQGLPPSAEDKSLLVYDNEARAWLPSTRLRLDEDTIRTATLSVTDGFGQTSSIFMQPDYVGFRSAGSLEITADGRGQSIHTAKYVDYICVGTEEFDLRFKTHASMPSQPVVDRLCIGHNEGYFESLHPDGKRSQLGRCNAYLQVETLNLTLNMTDWEPHIWEYEKRKRDIEHTLGNANITFNRTGFYALSLRMHSTADVYARIWNLEFDYPFATVYKSDLVTSVRYITASANFVVQLRCSDASAHIDKLEFYAVHLGDV